MKVLIISQNEICYNPRLAKAGDFLASKGFKISVLNPLVGVGAPETYKNFVSKRKWLFIESIIDKSTFKSKIKWLAISIIHAAYTFVWKHFRLKIGFPFILSKNVLFASNYINKDNYDIILTNLMELLPYAVRIKKKVNAPYLIFDSQEYFKGQYSKYERYKYEWIVEAEKDYVHHANLILVTTSVMLEKLRHEYSAGNKIVRIRNLPQKGLWFNDHEECVDSTLKLVWHGMSINYGNCRGVHILVDAVAKCKTDVHLYLQGKLSSKDYQAFKKRIEDLKVEDKITFLPPADPEAIVDSIRKFDIGLAGEIPEEDNQLLTSSNKLFDYIAAGLVTVVPNLPGLKETVEHYETGILYESENSSQLASIIDQLNSNRSKLKQYKLNSSNAFRNELYWENDYEMVWKKILESEKPINNISSFSTF